MHNDVPCLLTVDQLTIDIHSDNTVSIEYLLRFPQGFHKKYEDRDHCCYHIKGCFKTKQELLDSL